MPAFQATYIDSNGAELRLRLGIPQPILAQDGVHRPAYPLRETSEDGRETIHWLDGSFRTVRVDRLCSPPVTTKCDYVTVLWHHAGPPNPYGIGLLSVHDRGPIVHRWLGKSYPVEMTVRSIDAERVYETSPIASLHNWIYYLHGKSFIYRDAQALPAQITSLVVPSERLTLSHIEYGDPLPLIEEWPDLHPFPSDVPRLDHMVPGAEKAHPKIGVSVERVIEKLKEVDEESRSILSNGGCVLQVDLPIFEQESDTFGRPSYSQRFTIDIADGHSSQGLALERRTDRLTGNEVWEVERLTGGTEYTCQKSARSPWPNMGMLEAIEHLDTFHVSGEKMGYLVSRLSSAVELDPQYGWDFYSVRYTPDWIDVTTSFAISYNIVVHAQSGGLFSARIHPDDVHAMDAGL